MIEIGRPSITTLYPEIQTYVQDFISLHSDKLEAQSRRRDDLEYCGGFTLPELKDYVDTRFKEDQTRIVKVSCKSLHRMFSAPNKSYKNAKSYKEIFGIKKFGGENTLTKLHGDDHYCKTQIKLIINFISTISDKLNMKKECLLLSIDDKCKVKIGVPAVSRHVKLRKYFEIAKGGPQTSDHDFPLGKKYLIIPSGYLELDVSHDIIEDKLKRRFYKKPENGELYIYNRPFLFTNSNALT